MSSALKSCIACAEQIKQDAKLCRFCGTRQDDKSFTSATVEELTSPPLPPESEAVQEAEQAAYQDVDAEREADSKKEFRLVLGIGLATIVLALGIAWAFTSSQSENETAQSYPPSENEGLIFQPLRQGDIPFTALSPGMCLNDAGLADGYDYEGLPGANCFEPHDSEVSKIGVVPPSPWPISAEVEAEVLEICEAAFFEYTGLDDAQAAQFLTGPYLPSKREWDNNVRIFACIIFNEDGSKKTGSLAANPEVSSSTSGELTVREIYDRVLPSVVTVECGEWQGTGFAYNVSPASGYNSVIVTNHHVIEDCTFSPGPTVAIITYEDTRPESKLWNWDETNDLAIIMTTASLPILDDAPEADIGDQVVAIGSPLGFSGTITTGIISQVYSDAYQTDAAINPGNSGGPLLDMRGRLLGVNTLGFGREGLNIAFRPELLCERILVCD